MLGSAIGALSCVRLLSIGKLRLIYLLNLTLCIGVSISLGSQNVWLLCIGRLIWGYALGAFTVACAKFVNEICPIELYGSFGAMNQVISCLGSCLPNTLALAYPVSFEDLDKNDYYVQIYWHYIWSLPLLVSALQIVLLSTCFNHETPLYLK